MCYVSRDNSNDSAAQEAESLPGSPQPTGQSGLKAAGSTLACLAPAEEPWLTEGGARLRAGKLVAFPTGDPVTVDIIGSFSSEPRVETVALPPR